MCASGEASLWDLRKMGAGAVAASAAPPAACPGGATACAALSPRGDELVVSGPAGAFSASVAPNVGGGFGPWAELPRPGGGGGQGRGPRSLTFGGRHGALVMAGGDDGTVSVYRQW